MMADHWKLIANRLGAPGVDEPEVETQAAEPLQPEPPTLPRTPPRTKSSAGESPAARADAATGRGAVTRGDAELDNAGRGSTPPPSQPVSPSSEFSFDPNLPIPDEALSFKPSRAKSARHETKSESKTQSPPAARTFSEPPTDVAPEARREAPRMPDRVEPPAAPAAAAPPAKPAKRKSSWESLASMFNIKVDRSKAAEVEVEPAPPLKSEVESTDRPERTAPASSRDRDHERPSQGPTSQRPTSQRPSSQGPTSWSESEQQLSIFSGEQADEPNAALKSMFGDAPPASPDSWGKPRMVDDLGWDEDDDTPAVKSGFQAAEPAADDEEAVEETARRGRRRRRGRRGRGDAPESPAAANEKTSRWGGVDETEELSGQDDEWPEPDSFELADNVALADDLETDLDAEDVAGEDEPERRSNRRRRRGRGRGRDQVDASEPSPTERAPQRPRTAPAARIEDEGVSFRPEVDDEEDFDSDVVATEPSRGSTSDEDRGTRGRRRRRGRGGSSEEGRQDRPAARGRTPREPQRGPAPPVDDEDFDEDLELAVGFEGEEGEDEMSGDGKHRSIPTWADSIQSLVTANMENRKRGDNRGAPRSRPRGRR